MSSGSRFFRLPLILFLTTVLEVQGLPAAQQFRLVKTGTTGATDSIRFTGVACNELGPTVPTAAPVITGNNLYAPDLLRVGDSWHTYYGGWLTNGQVNDKGYLGVSSTLNPAGSYSPASQLIVNNGTYNHVNDISVVRVSAKSWYMFYTVAPKTPAAGGDWINYSTSTDGIHWTPSEATATTGIKLVNAARYGIVFCARPSLVKTPAGWSMWFDADDRHSYLAQATSAAPDNFTVVKKYDDAGGFPGFYEPDVQRRADGTYIAVIQRNFSNLHYATSLNGIDFTVNPTPALSVSNPMVGRAYIDNPSLIYDSATDRVLGLSYGMSDDSKKMGHDIGFSFCQYQVRVQSPDGTWHVHGNALSSDQQNLKVFGYRRFSRVQVLDPANGAVLMDQDFSSATVGDQWRLMPIPEPSKAVIPPTVGWAS